MVSGPAGQSEISAAEAANLNALADYALCYGSLLMFALLGLMALMIALGMPVYGRFGALEIFAVLARLCSSMLFVFALYALYCCLRGCGRVRPGAGARLFILSVAFWCAGLEGDGDVIMQLLLWLGRMCPSCGLTT